MAIYTSRVIGVEIWSTETMCVVLLWELVVVVVRGVCFFCEVANN